MPELELQGSTSSTALGWEQLCKNTPTLTEPQLLSTSHASSKIPSYITEMLGTLFFSLSFVFILENRASWHKMGVLHFPLWPIHPLGSAWREWLGTDPVTCSCLQAVAIHFTTGQGWLRISEDAIPSALYFLLLWPHQNQPLHTPLLD